MTLVDTVTIERAQQWARGRLSHYDTGALDSRVLLCHVLQQGLSYLMTWSDRVLTDAQWRDYQSLVVRRGNGEPVAHLTGEREFWSLSLEVTPDTLIPRPETEHLVEAVLAAFDDTPRRVLDLGTGTGAIALALAKERPSWTVIGVDTQTAIIELAQRNAQRNQIDNATFHVSHWFEQLAEQRFDSIVSNPPYIDADDDALTEGDVRFEPSSALVAERHGMADIEHIAQQAPYYLRSNGGLFLEHGYNQGEACTQLLRQEGFMKVQTWRDLAGNARITMGFCK